MNKKPPIPSTPKAVQDCRDLLLWMIPHLDKLPKNRRYTLGEKLETRILTVLESLVSAAYASNKRQLSNSSAHSESPPHPQPFPRKG